MRNQYRKHCVANILFIIQKLSKQTMIKNLASAGN